MIRTPAQIIDAKGGAIAFAPSVGVTAATARVWKHRNAFPRKFWPEITAAHPELDTKALLAAERAAKRQSGASHSGRAA
jgi:hypothetical protein